MSPIIQAPIQPPGGGGLGPCPTFPRPEKAGTYSDAQIRGLITHILSTDAASGLPYGAHGEKWPSGIPQGESKTQAALVIVDQYLTLIGRGDCATNAYPHPDPGRAEAGLGPTGIGITSILDFLKLLTSANFWMRVLEVLLGLGLALAGLAKLSTRADGLVSKVPVYGKILR
jgi:hypothetical protein